MKRVISLSAAVILMMFLLGAVSRDADPLAPPPNEGWSKVTETAGKYIVYSKDQPNSAIQALLLIGIINYSPKQTFDVCTDYDHFEDFMPYVKYSHIVHVEQLHDQERVTFSYFFLTPPLISARYYTLKYNDDMNITYDGIPGCYLNTWELVTKGVYHTTPESPGVVHLKHKADSIELKSNLGWWRFEPLDGGKKTRMLYYVSTDPGGDIPGWIQNKAQKVSVKGLYDAINDRLKEVTK